MKITDLFIQHRTPTNIESIYMCITLCDPIL